MNQTLNCASGAAAPAPSDSEVDTLGVASWVLSALVMFTCVCGMAGNGLVVWLLGFRVQRTPCSVYILHLAMADFLFLLCMASLLTLETSPLAHQHPVAYEVLRTLKYFFYTTGLSLLTAISTQRCLSVLFPVWYKCHQPRHLSAGVCSGLWALSLVLNTLALFFCSEFWHWDRKQCFAVDSVVSALIMGLFTPVLAVSSMTLFVRVRRGLRRRRPTRLYVVILASVLVYLTCALPLGVSWFLLSWLSLQQWVEVLYHNLSRLTSSVSSSANPVIYSGACGSPWGPCCVGHCGTRPSWRGGRRSPPEPTRWGADRPRHGDPRPAPAQRLAGRRSGAPRTSHPTLLRPLSYEPKLSHSTSCPSLTMPLSWKMKCNFLVCGGPSSERAKVSF